MNKGCVFVLGFLAAIFLVTLIPYLNGKSSNEEPQQTEEVVDKEAIVREFLRGDKHAENPQRENIQYIDIRGKHGEVTVHTYMSKDSVKILIGKPTRVNLMTIGNDAHEYWEYDFPNQGQYGTTRRLNISFVNGELKEIREY